MALPSSGQLSLSQIGTELSITAGNQASLRSMSSTAGFATPDPVSEFHGYSAAENIIMSFSQHTPSLTSTTFDQNATVNHAGHTAASTFKCYVSCSLTTATSGSCTWYRGYSSSGPWTSFVSRSVTGTSNFYLPATFLTYTETFYIRVYISRSASGSIIGSTTISPTLYQLGTGAIDSYTATSNVWTQNF